MAFDLGSIAVGVGTVYGALKGNKSSTKGSSNTEAVESTGTESLEKLVQDLNRSSVAQSNTNTTNNNKTLSDSKSTTSTKGTTNENQNTSTVGSSVGTQTSTGTTTGLNFSADVVNQLQSLLGSTIAGSGVVGQQQTIADRLASISQQANSPGLDPVAFADGITSQAATRLGGDLEGNLNNMMSQIGGSEAGNSMAALLGNRLRNDTANELAGIRSNALATGYELNRQQNESLTGQIAALSQAGTGSLTGLIDSIRGAMTTQETQQRATDETYTQEDQNRQTNTVNKGTTNTKSQDRTVDQGKTNTSTLSSEREKSNLNQSTTSILDQIRLLLEDTNSSSKSKNGGSLLDNLNSALTGSTAKA